MNDIFDTPKATLLSSENGDLMGTSTSTTTNLESGQISTQDTDNTPSWPTP